MKIALIGTFPPRRCGIATFTNDLNEGIKQTGCKTVVIAINDGLKKYNYPDDVQFEIEQNEVISYVRASNYLNTNNIDAVILQHEYGIFGGSYGEHILQLLKRLRMPVITTLHTIIDNPTPEQKSIMSEIGRLSSKVISISQKGMTFLETIYNMEPEKIEHIHHGVHKISFENAPALKQQLGVKNKKILLSFGLLSRNKSLEVAIKALYEVKKDHPDVVYIILGATHPHVLKMEGEDYRHSLIRLIKKLGLEKNVILIDRFVTNAELFDFLAACDIYIIPYQGEKQISSGTLIYTMGAGKPIISTPFWYAREMLANDRGILFDFNNQAQLAQHINDLLNHDEKRKTIGANALKLAEQCYWPKIGQNYLEIVRKAYHERLSLTSNYQMADDKEASFTLPPLNLTHLKVLTDDTGILQHARYNVPDRSYGYCIDDNARALILSTMLQDEVQDTDLLIQLTSIYLSFIDFALNPNNGKFRNFMSYNREWLEEQGSEDSFGRTLWALGYTASKTKIENFHHHSEHLFHKGLKHINDIKFPRALAYAILGLAYYLEKHDDETIRQLLAEKAARLSACFDETIDDKEWIWYEEIVTYANARIPHALLLAGVRLQENAFIQRGLKLLDWLIKKQFVNSLFLPIGNNNWLTRDQKASFDQQPIEAHGMIDACILAEKITHNLKYGDYAMSAFAWFTGENEISQPLYDFATGGCRDGLHPKGVNLNQGAESTLSCLLSLIQISYYVRNKNK